MDATITTRCKLQVVEEVYEKLDTNFQKKLRESCFGSLLRLKDIKLASQIVHQLLLRKTKTNNKGDIWFKIGDKRARFGLQEFVLVTGLRAGDGDNVDKTLGMESRIVKEYFKNCGGKIMRGDIYNAFVTCRKRKSDKYKLGLIVILAYVLWATEENTLIDLWWLDLVDDLDRFETYPWGKLSFEYTVNIFKREMGDKLKSSDVGGESRCRYSLHGFPLAIMIWAFEAIPSLGMKFATKDADVIPRMVAWEMPKRLASAAIDNVLKLKEVEVNETLIPTKIELDSVYWKELEPISPEYESASYQPEGDEAEHDVEPPPVSTEINIVDLLRTEMEKLEGRLQAVISTRLDRVEKKVDRLIELAVSGRFHSVTSAFDGATSSTAYVPAHEPKEAGFDDVMDVPADERKVEELEDDPELEEKVKGKNGRGNGAEVGSGNDTDQQEKEKMIEEGVGKIVQDEHPDMEKDIADFVTPYKHEVDANKSTQGDVVQIEEVGSASPKGRGYRPKRKARLLCSPFTDPTKRRKLLDIDVYNPYREVDPVKVDALNKWMETASSGLLIPLRFYDVEAKTLTGLLNDDGWISGSIMDEALYQIRERASKFPHLFQQDCCILDTYFYQFVLKTHGQMQQRKELNISKSLINYVRGTTPELSKPWKDCRYLYIPCCTGSHWFALKIDLEERTIFKFDSLKGHIRRAELEAYVLPLQEVIPLLIKSHVTSEENYSSEKFKFMNVKDVPQQVNGSDCGIFTLKYIDFLQANMDVQEIRQDYVPIWRKKLAAELLAWDFEP